MSTDIVKVGEFFTCPVCKASVPVVVAIKITTRVTGLNIKVTTEVTGYEYDHECTPENADA